MTAEGARFWVRLIRDDLSQGEEALMMALSVLVGAGIVGLLALVLP